MPEEKETSDFIQKDSFLMPHFPTYQYTEPNFCESHLVTWSGENGELVSHYQGEFFYEPLSPRYPVVFEFIAEFWNEVGWADEADSEKKMFSDWRRDSQGLFSDDDWKEEIFGFDYEYGAYGAYENGLDKAEGFFEGEERKFDGYHSYDSIEEQLTPDYDSWFRYKDEQDCQDYHMQGHEFFSSGYRPYEIEISEQIFGCWPCHPRIDQDSCVSYMDMHNLSLSSSGVAYELNCRWFS